MGTRGGTAWSASGGRGANRQGPGRAARVGAAGAVLALVVGLLGACTARSGGEASVGSQPGIATDAVGGALPPVEQTVGSAEAASTPEKGAYAGIAASPRVIVTGEAILSTADPADSMARLGGAVAALGGTTASSSLDGQGGGQSAWATYRIPSASFRTVLDSLSAYGRIARTSTSTQDVGAQLTDLEARIAALETSTARLKDLMARATSTKDLLDAETQLTTRQAELDSLRSQRTWLADQVDMSTLTVTFTPQPVPGEPSGSAWERSWDAFVAGLKSVAVGLIWVAPWMLLVVPAGALVWWLASRALRRRRPRAGVGSPAPAVASVGPSAEVPSAAGPTTPPATPGDAPAGSGDGT